MAQVGFSPRMWRCFSRVAAVLEFDRVFSTYVEVFPITLSFRGLTVGFLHVCGGVSRKRVERIQKSGFSPRMWRCFHQLVDSR